MVILKFVSGETLELRFGSHDSGETTYGGSYSSGATYYSNYCVINDEALIALNDNYIDKVRIYWHEGYEDYVVQEGDLIKSQLKCLNELVVEDKSNADSPGGDEGGSNNSIVDELMQLKQLFEQGLLTEEEFTKAKAKLLKE